MLPIDGERVVGSNDSSVFARFANWKCTTKLLCQHFRWNVTSIHDETVCLIHSTAALS